MSTVPGLVAAILLSAVFFWHVLALVTAFAARWPTISQGERVVVVIDTACAVWTFTSAVALVIFLLWTP